VTPEVTGAVAPLEPEYRRDPVTGRWVVVAPERSLRPMSLAGAQPPHRANGEGRPCPFCPGQEHDTPHEVYALREAGTAPDARGWRLRVVPNKFPAVRVHSPAYGVHEVVIETPDHVSNPTALSDEQFRDVLCAYRERLLAHAADPRLAYAMVFKNVGAEAGASLGHSHSQIVGTPFVPDLIATELAGAKAYHDEHGRCVFCDLHRDAGERVVAESEHFVAFAPFAPRFAYELWVIPKEHASRYESLTDALELAQLLKRVLRSLDAVLAEPAYNLYLHAAPLRSPELPHFHWHIEIMPRISRPAGFEWGAGCFVIDTSPERAAAELRAV
jgi:UDPglucose--hexose-1-phosphate uridylyltransferase